MRRLNTEMKPKFKAFSVPIQADSMSILSTDTDLFDKGKICRPFLLKFYPKNIFILTFNAI